MRKALVLGVVLIMVFAFAGTASAVCVANDKFCNVFYVNYNPALGIWIGQDDGCEGYYLTRFPVYIKAGPYKIVFLDYDQQRQWPPDPAAGDYCHCRGTGFSLPCDRYFNGAYYDTWQITFSLCKGEDSGGPPADAP